MAVLWALLYGRKRTRLEFGLCCLVPLQGLLLAQDRCLSPKSHLPPRTLFVSPTVNIVLSGRLSSAVPALGE